MIKNPRLLIVCIAVPLLVGALASFLTRDSMAAFAALEKPPLSPPGIILGICTGWWDRIWWAEMVGCTKWWASMVG